jgi:translocation and assembly module TamA
MVVSFVPYFFITSFHDRYIRMVTKLLNSYSRVRPGISIFVFALLINCIFTVAVNFSEASVQVNVTVDGLDGAMLENVLAFLSLERQKSHPDLTSDLVEKLHKKAQEEIHAALRPFGYYKPAIQSELVREDSKWHALYTVDKGIPILIESINFSIKGKGTEDSRFKVLEERMPFKKGDVLNHQLYEEGKRILQNTAALAGYLSAEIMESRVDVYSEKNSAIVTLHFDTGPQYLFGKVKFVQEAFDPEFIRRFVPFQKGDPYNLSKHLKLQNDLNDSDYFESIEVTPRLDEAEGLEVPVTVVLVPRKQHQYTLGAGYGTDTGFRGSAGWENRRVNKRGHRLKSKIRLSEIGADITTEYLVPLKKPRTDNITFTSGVLKEDIDTYDSEKYFVSVRFNHMRYSWKESIYVNYEQEEFDVATDSGQSRLLMPGISWTRIRADNPVIARKGSRLFFDIRGAHDNLLSNTSFLQLRMQFKYIRGITSKSRLILRGEGGTSLIDIFSDLPPSVRFFAGGDNSVRGYEYKSLGPEDSEGDVIGGKHLLVGSIELEHEIRDKWSVAVFYDSGNALDDFSDKIKNGAGFGIHWSSPVGPVRLDIGFPLDEADESWRLHFIIGPDL